MEARVGIEPTYKGFADLSLTTWVPRPQSDSISKPCRTFSREAAGVSLRPSDAEIQLRSGVAVLRMAD